MLHVMAVVRFQEQHGEAGCAAVAELAKRSRSEPGCVRYDVFRRIGEAVVLTQEVWQDEAAEQAHMQGANLAAAFATVAQLLAAPVEIHRCTQVG